LIGYTYRFGERLSAGVSIEMPSVRTTTFTETITDPVTGTVKETDIIVPATQTIPDIPAFVQFKTSKFHVKLAAALRNINYGYPPQEQIKTKQGWGVQISGSFKPFPELTICGQGIYGKGIARYISDLRVSSFDLLPNLSNPVNMEAQTMYSASVGLRVDISQKIYLSSNFGFAEVDKNKALVRNSDYRYGTYLSTTFFWKVYSNLIFAAEYLNGYRQNMNFDSGNANRLQAMLRYSF
jgi:hypothetical protein